MSVACILFHHLWESVEALDEVWVFNTKFPVSQAYISCHGVKVVGYLCSLAYKSQSQKVECHLKRYIFMVLKGTHLVTRILLNYYEISCFLSHYVLFSVCALIMMESTMTHFKKAKKKIMWQILGFLSPKLYYIYNFLFKVLNISYCIIKMKKINL